MLYSMGACCTFAGCRGIGAVYVTGLQFRAKGRSLDIPLVPCERHHHAINTGFLRFLEVDGAVPESSTR